MNGNPPCMQKMMTPPGMPGMKGPGMKGPHGDKGPWAHKKGFRHDMMDSILQVTPEQKTALEKHRQQMDSSFKALNGQKMAAEKELREALDNGAAEQIDAAKAKILSAQEALLAARVEGVKNLKTILTEEQQAITRRASAPKTAKAPVLKALARWLNRLPPATRNHADKNSR